MTIRELHQHQLHHMPPLSINIPSSIAFIVHSCIVYYYSVRA